MHWNEQQTSTNRRLDRIKIWSRLSDPMKCKVIHCIYTYLCVICNQPGWRKCCARLARWPKSQHWWWSADDRCFTMECSEICNCCHWTGWFLYMRPPIITFVAEDAEDEGGPRQEFFRWGFIHVQLFFLIYIVIQTDMLWQLYSWLRVWLRMLYGTIWQYTPAWRGRLWGEWQCSHSLVPRNSTTCEPQVTFRQLLHERGSPAVLSEKRNLDYRHGSRKQNTTVCAKV